MATNVYAATSEVNNVIRFGFNYPPGGISIDNPVGAIPVSNISKLITLEAETTSATTGHYYQLMSLASPASKGEYQVPIGKTFQSVGYYMSTGSAQVCVTWGYGTATFTDDTNTTPTGAVDYTASTAGCGVRNDTGSDALRFIPLPISFPASSFPYIKFQSSAVRYHLQMIGFEN